MTRFEMTPDTPFTGALPVEERVTTFLRAVYGWMCGGLAITALTASVIASSPAIVIAVEMSPIFIRSLSVTVASNTQAPFVEIGRMRGLSEQRLFYQHVLRNSAVPILNLFGVQLGALLGGVLIVEYIFSYPGLGFTTVQAVLQRDFPTIQGIAMLTSSVFVVINIVVDLISAYIDPRLDY